MAPRAHLSWWGSYGLCQRHKLTELAHSLLFCSCVYLRVYGPFNCISFHKLSRQLSIFSLCSSGIISALLVLSAIHLFMKDSFSPDRIYSGWLGSKHQLTTTDDRIIIIIAVQRRLFAVPQNALLLELRRKVQWYGHVSRSSSLAKTILQGTVKWGRRQTVEKVGRQNEGTDRPGVH